MSKLDRRRFLRAAADCHLPGGSANYDLSYYGAWVAQRQLIYPRVIEKIPTPMPPLTASKTLTAAELAAIQAWTLGDDVDGGDGTDAGSRPGGW